MREYHVSIELICGREISRRYYITTSLGFKTDGEYIRKMVVDEYEDELLDCTVVDCVN